MTRSATRRFAMSPVSSPASRKVVTSVRVSRTADVVVEQRLGSKRQEVELPQANELGFGSRWLALDLLEGRGAGWILGRSQEDASIEQFTLTRHEHRVDRTLAASLRREDDVHVSRPHPPPVLGLDAVRRQTVSLFLGHALAERDVLDDPELLCGVLVIWGHGRTIVTPGWPRGQSVVPLVPDKTRQGVVVPADWRAASPVGARQPERQSTGEPMSRNRQRSAGPTTSSAARVGKSRESGLGELLARRRKLSATISI
jgi:hypothetical protein